MSLFDGLKDVREKLFNFDEINTDNFVCKLHHMVTVIILIAFSILLSLSQVLFNGGKSKKKVSRQTLPQNYTYRYNVVMSGQQRIFLFCLHLNI